MKLVYSREAVADLARLRAFIQTHDPAAASRIGNELITRIWHPCRLPEMGRRVEQAPEPDSIRDSIFGKYIARYSIHQDVLVVLRIWHHYEDRDADA